MACQNFIIALILVVLAQLKKLNKKLVLALTVHSHDYFSTLKNLPSNAGIVDFSVIQSKREKNYHWIPLNISVFIHQKSFSIYVL